MPALAKGMGFLRGMSRTGRWFLWLALFLVVLRMILPTAILYGLNWALAHKVPGYHGSIEDFDLALWRGRYRIEGLRLIKNGFEGNPPLLDLRTMNVDLSWKGLFQGRLLTKIHLAGVQVHLLDSQDSEKDQLGTKDTGDWRELYWTLVPFELTELTVTDGGIHFANLDAGLENEFYLSGIVAIVRNVQNLDRDQSRLPTPVFLKARMQDKTPIRLEGRTNFLLNPAEVDLDLEMRDFELKELNPLLQAYVPVTFDRGRITLFSEVATRERRIKGYVKPFIEDVKVMGDRRDFLSFPHFGIEFLTAFANVIFRDAKKTIATRIEFDGTFDDPEIRTGKAVWGALGNAYTGKKLERKLDDDIDPVFNE